ncbi:hypothetical protein [Paractinoplanes rishiriensis]|uniref:Uncharacterized protein n=1 Tax=Paractinoplanes rishiriensis TaxID=1050105 RepID=A0A919N2K7_9ACTN|nr:hypothetical protein [Actinoplanes rishiriensis]GIF00643.1 hypothetical protein Ari01nite_81070 [Actinoplanes rishiriensis]
MSHPLVPAGRTTLVPGRLDASVFQHHADPDIALWVFTTHGFEALGGRELVLFVRRHGNAHPQSPFQIFSVIFDQVSRGASVNPDTLLTLGGNLDLDPRVGGLLCLDFRDDSRQRLPRADAYGHQTFPILLLPLLTEEAEATRMLGQPRMLSQLSRATDCWPYPWWFEPGRKPALTMTPPAGRNPSMLAGLPLDRAPVSYLEALLTGPHLDLRLPIEDCDRFVELLSGGRDTMVLFPCALSPAAHGRLVWEPGQDHIGAQAEPGRTVGHGEMRLAGNFLVLAHGDVADETRFLEDGFAVMVAGPTWQRLIDALRAKKPVTWRASGYVTEVSLDLHRRTHTSPFVDTGREDFMTYSPDQLYPRAGERRLRNAELDRTVLLTDQRTIAAAVTAEALAAYLHELELAVDDELEGVEHGCEEIAVFVQLPVGVSMAARPDVLPVRVGERLVRRLDEVPAPPIEGVMVQLEVYFRCGRG